MSEESPIARMQRRLRAETAKLLDYDNLTAAERVRLDRAATLRLQLDDIQAAQLRGEPVDVPRFIIASEALERLVGGSPDAPNMFDADKAVADLEKTIQNLIDVRRHKAAEAEAKISNPGGGDAHLISDTHAADALTAARANLPAPIPQPTNVIPIDATARANANRPPEHYLREGQREPWRDYAERGSGVPGGVLGQPLPSWWGK